MDFAVYIKFVLALILVVGLILALAWVLKRFGLADARALGRKRRLMTIESTSIDGRNRVVLLRRDDVEHLVLVGPNTSTVIESGIPAGPLPDPIAVRAFGSFLPGTRPGDQP